VISGLRRRRDREGLAGLFRGLWSLSEGPRRAVLRARPGAPGEGRFETPAEEFRLARIEVDAPQAFEAAAERGVEIWICIDGAGRLTSADQMLDLRRGESLLVPAAAPACRVEGRGVFYRAAAGGAPDPPADSLPAS
jgi:mannose-6-phosphate isomerase class I